MSSQERSSKHDNFILTLRSLRTEDSILYTEYLYENAEENARKYNLFIKDCQLWEIRSIYDLYKISMVLSFKQPQISLILQAQIFLKECKQSEVGYLCRQYIYNEALKKADEVFCLNFCFISCVQISRASFETSSIRILLCCK